MTDTALPVLDVGIATGFARLALSHVTREYPGKLDHVLYSGEDVLPPRVLHPVFFGSFDWHSCVHGYWLLARVLRRFPGIPLAQEIRELFDSQLTAEKIGVEVDYASHPSRKGFERPYGWAWLLMLVAEFELHPDASSGRWAEALQPLAQVFVERFRAFLPIATYPIRSGAHFNTAFALILALEYARVTRKADFEWLLVETAIRWYSKDRDCRPWEPGGDDFLSPTLIEAECMRRALGADFPGWFESFLPDLAERKPETLFTPATVSDRSDGKIAHLDGLNLSRAWCWRRIAAAYPDSQIGSEALRAAAIHLETSLPHVAGDYMGEHWLATFALLALDDT